MPHSRLRWYERRSFPWVVFVGALLLVTAAWWSYAEYRERRAAAELAEMTRHYEREITQQLEASRTTTPESAPAEGP